MLRQNPLRRLQREFQAHTGVRDYSATDGVSPGICHQVAREHIIEPGDFKVWIGPSSQEGLEGEFELVE